MNTEGSAGRAGPAGLALALLLAGCGESKPLECSVTTDPLTAASDGSVTYEAFTSGPATVLAVTYAGGGAEIEIESPELPWEETVAVESGDVLSISATGTAEPGGTFTARYSFASVLGGTPTVTFASCGK